LITDVANRPLIESRQSSGDAPEGDRIAQAAAQLLGARRSGIRSIHCTIAHSAN